MRILTAILVALVILAVGQPAMAQTTPSGAPEGWPPPVLDSQTYSLVLFDQLEFQQGRGLDGLSWDALSWIGGDYNRLWIETEGQVSTGGNGGEIERFDVLYGRLIAPFWDLQAGTSYQRVWSMGEQADRVSAVIGLQGLAPYIFEVDTNLRISQDGDVSADLQATYDLLLTQRIVLQPRFETLVAVQEVQEFGIGRGFNSVRLGLRLRYEIRREVAPYIGFTWAHKLGGTADLARANGEDVQNLAVLVGGRIWF